VVGIALVFQKVLELNSAVGWCLLCIIIAGL